MNRYWEDFTVGMTFHSNGRQMTCLLYTSDAADE